MQITALQFPLHLGISRRPLFPQVTNTFGKILTYVPELADALDDALDDDNDGY